MGGKRVTKPDVVVGVDLVTDKKVLDLEKAVVSNLPANQFDTAHQVHYILVAIISKIVHVNSGSSPKKQPNLAPRRRRRRAESLGTCLLSGV